MICLIRFCLYLFCPMSSVFSCHSFPVFCFPFSFFFVFGFLSMVFCLLFSVFGFLSMVFCLLFFVFCFLFSVICLLSSVFSLLLSHFVFSILFSVTRFLGSGHRGNCSLVEHRGNLQVPYIYKLVTPSIYPSVHAYVHPPPDPSDWSGADRQTDRRMDRQNLQIPSVSYRTLSLPVTSGAAAKAGQGYR